MFFKICIKLNVFLLFNVFMFSSMWSPIDIHTGGVGFLVWIIRLKDTHPKCQASSHVTRDISRGKSSHHFTPYHRGHSVTSV